MGAPGNTSSSDLTLMRHRCSPCLSCEGCMLLSSCVNLAMPYLASGFLIFPCYYTMRMWGWVTSKTLESLKILPTLLME